MKKLYKNKDWLYWEYSIVQKSAVEIAKLLNVGVSTIYRWMKKFNIPRRSISLAHYLNQRNYCNLSHKAIEFINGELLGDGNLYPFSLYSASFQYASKYREYTEYISNKLESFGIKQSGEIHKRNYNGITYHYASLRYPILLKYYNKWYPNGKKIVPKDIKLTPITLRQWYIGDGCLVKYNRGNPYIKLYTYAYSTQEVNNLIQKLNKLKLKSTYLEASNSIHISAYSTLDFLNYIGECPIKCYQYKWE